MCNVSSPMSHCPSFGVVWCVTPRGDVSVRCISQTPILTPFANCQTPRWPTSMCYYHVKILNESQSTLSLLPKSKFLFLISNWMWTWSTSVLDKTVRLRTNLPACYYDVKNKIKNSNVWENKPLLHNPPNWKLKFALVNREWLPEHSKPSPNQEPILIWHFIKFKQALQCIGSHESGVIRGVRLISAGLFSKVINEGSGQAQGFPRVTNTPTTTLHLMSSFIKPEEPGCLFRNGPLFQAKWTVIEWKQVKWTGGTLLSKAKEKSVIVWEKKRKAECVCVKAEEDCCSASMGSGGGYERVDLHIKSGKCSAALREPPAKNLHSQNK